MRGRPITILFRTIRQGNPPTMNCRLASLVISCLLMGTASTAVGAGDRLELIVNRNQNHNFDLIEHEVLVSYIENETEPGNAR
jgi:hypothetical protein